MEKIHTDDSEDEGKTSWGNAEVCGGWARRVKYLVEVLLRHLKLILARHEKAALLWAGDLVRPRLRGCELGVLLLQQFEIRAGGGLDAVIAIGLAALSIRSRPHPPGTQLRVQYSPIVVFPFCVPFTLHCVGIFRY